MKTKPLSLTPSVPPDDRLLKVSEVAATLNVSVRQVWRLRTMGELASVKIGRSSRFSHLAVQAYLARKRAEGEKAA